MALAVSLTAIGDTVNVASRLQDLTKEYGCQLVISEEVAKHAGMNVDSFPCHDLTVRNRREALTIYVIKDVQEAAGANGPGILRRLDEGNRTAHASAHRDT